MSYNPRSRSRSRSSQEGGGGEDYCHYYHYHYPLEWLRPADDDEEANDTDDTNDDGGSPLSSASTRMILPSFIDLQRKTKLTLYGKVESSSSKTKTGDDKSPKGSVDGPIRPLVDLINHHSMFTTLSSCSGRSSLFDPNEKHIPHDDNDNDDDYHHYDVTKNNMINKNNNNKKNNNNNDAAKKLTQQEQPTNKSTEFSGKGGGGWLLVNHYLLKPKDFLACFGHYDGNNDDVDDKSGDYTDNIPSNCWIFKYEPALLHVGACSLQKGKQLLRIALDCGYRESGLIVTNQRVTVAIRTHSLSLTVPLLPVGPLKPPRTYILSLIQQANMKQQQNWKQLYKLYQKIELELFHLRNIPPTNIYTMTQDISKPSSSSLPSLNLWNAAIVAVNKKCKQKNKYALDHDERDDDNDGDEDENNKRKMVAHHENEIDVYAFGGYGIGPIINQKKVNVGKKRSSCIYKLKCKSSIWDSTWSKVSSFATNDDKEEEDGKQSDTSKSNSNAFTFSSLSKYKNSFEIMQQLPECQGMAACLLDLPTLSTSTTSNESVLKQEQQQMILLWGGRTSPNNALNGLYIFDSQEEKQPEEEEEGKCCCHALLRPKYVYGDIPSPRWGHTFKPLSSSSSSSVNTTTKTTTRDENFGTATRTTTTSANKSNRAILIGGCNATDGALDDMYILHVSMLMNEPMMTAANSTTAATAKDGKHSSVIIFVWEKLSMTLPTPRFHHTSVVFPFNGGNKKTKTKLEIHAGTHNGGSSNDDDTDVENENDDIICIFGGLESTKDIFFEATEDDNDDESDKNVSSACFIFQVRRRRRQEQQQGGGGGSGGSTISCPSKTTGDDGMNANDSLLIFTKTQTDRIPVDTTMIPPLWQEKMSMQQQQRRRRRSYSVLARLKSLFGSSACIVKFPMTPSSSSSSSPLYSSTSIRREIPLILFSGGIQATTTTTTNDDDDENDEDEENMAPVLFGCYIKLYKGRKKIIKDKGKKMQQQQQEQEQQWRAILLEIPFSHMLQTQEEEQQKLQNQQQMNTDPGKAKTNTDDKRDQDIGVGDDDGILADVNGSVDEKQSPTSSLYASTIDNAAAQQLDFGCLVHHACIPVNNGNDIILIGGGVTSFAFGEMFARSYHLRLGLAVHEGNKTKNHSLQKISTDQNIINQVPSTTTLSVNHNHGNNIKAMTTKKKNKDYSKKSDLTNVLYVQPSNAKHVKNELEAYGWLNKSYRMTKVNLPSSTTTLSSSTSSSPSVRGPIIAIPITKQGLDALLGIMMKQEKSTERQDGNCSSENNTDSSSTSALAATTLQWSSLILDVGYDVEMPFSTAKFAAKSKSMM